MNPQTSTQLVNDSSNIQSGKHKIRICLGSSCFSKAKESNLEYIERFLKEHYLNNAVDFAGHLCIEQCSKGPNIEVDGVMYNEVDATKLEEILLRHFEIK